MNEVQILRAELEIGSLLKLILGQQNWDVLVKNGEVLVKSLAFLILLLKSR